MLSSYETHCRPKLSRMLRALRLDVPYRTASGLQMTTVEGRHVTDFVGGFGTLLLGHNHEELKRALTDALDENAVVHAQASVGTACGDLAARLNELLPTQTRYMVNFSNSGAETVEAALKHAYKRYATSVEAKFTAAKRSIDATQRELTRSRRLTPALRTQLEHMSSANEVTLHRLLTKPAIVAVKGSFHGKLTSSLKVTSNAAFREDFADLSSMRSLFIADKDIVTLPDLIAAENLTLSVPIVSGNDVSAHSIDVCGVMALILEVIQGEGGVRELSDEAMTYLAKAHASSPFPYIIDEVQTGCGRLGAIYGYSLTPLVAIDPEYITLSKALGGGLVKIGATLIRADTYDQDFSVQHTSTFGEDALAARVALKVLDLLTRDGHALLRGVRHTSARLREALDELGHSYPALVADVRGRGLMFGVELHALPNASPFFRATSETGALALFIASYLLHYHGLRMFCPLNSLISHGRLNTAGVIRIQPAYALDTDQIERLVRGLREVFDIILANDEYALVGHLFGPDVPEAERTRPRRFPAHLPRAQAAIRSDLITAFVAHPTSLEMLMDSIFPSMKGREVNSDRFRVWWENSCEFLNPTLVRSEYIRASDRLVRSDIILVPYLPAHIERLKREGNLGLLKQKIDDAVALAEDVASADGMPLSSVGLGAYTSIVSDNGESVRPRAFPVTTGNAYATALVVEGVERMVRQRRLDLGTLEVAIVGATGNIGSVLAEIFTRRCLRVRLIGRSTGDSLRRLELVRRGCARSLLQSLAIGDDKNSVVLQHLSALAAEALHCDRGGPVRQLIQRVKDGAALTSTELEQMLAIAESRSGLRIDITRDLSAVSTADVVIISTDSSDTELISPKQLKTGAIVCCASVPTNISREFIGHPDFFAFDGGLARLPQKSAVNYPGFPSGGLTYGCHSESIIAGLEHGSGFRSLGVLTAFDVARASDLASKHGFELGGLRLHNHELKEQSL